MRPLRHLLIGFLLTLGAFAIFALFTALLLVLRAAFPLPGETPTEFSFFRNTVTSTTEQDDTSNYLHDEEVIAIPPPTPPPNHTATTATTSEPTFLPLDRVLFEYVAVTDGCGPHFEGECLNARSGPGTDFPSVGKLRTGMVLKVGGKVENATSTWYKIVFDEWLRYPDRMPRNWYVNAAHVEVLRDEGDRTHDGKATTTKRILVDRGEQKLYAYDGDVLFMETSISTGLELTPTPRGTFTIFKKTPSRYMQGPLPYLAVSKYYDLPGVPWNMYFTEEGAVVHGAYWHDSFGNRYSSGCVNLRPEEARALYHWTPLGATVTVQD